MFAKVGPSIGSKLLWTGQNTKPILDQLKQCISSQYLKNVELVFVLPFSTLLCMVAKQ